MTQAPELARDVRGPVAPGTVAACALSAVPGLGPSSLGRIDALFGSLEAAVAAGALELAARCQSGQLDLRADARAFLARGPDLRAFGLELIDRARASGAWVVARGAPGYPAQLAGIDAPPPVLYVRGELRPGARRIALVGARNAQGAALGLARRLGEALATAGVEVVSGGARGVDAAAHAGALWGRGTTLAVLGCGIDVVYPRENAALFERIAGGGGALVSEFPPGTASIKGNFPRRNRTLSALSSAVVVVRAAAASGALITAACAADQGRPVFAVDGDPDDPLCAGPRALLASGAARPISSASEVLRQLGWPVPAQLEALERAAAGGGQTSLNRGEGPGHHRRSGSEESPEEPPVLDQASARLWALLDDRRPLHLDELLEKGKLGAQEALAGLQELELRGLCEQRPGKYYLRRRP